MDEKKEGEGKGTRVEIKLRVPGPVSTPRTHRTYRTSQKVTPDFMNTKVSRVRV